MRSPLLAFALIAACTPPAGDPDLLANATLAEGQWHFSADESAFSAGYASAPGQYSLMAMCNHADGAGALMRSQNLPAEPGDSFIIITGAATITLPGVVTTTGDVPNIAADLSTPDGKRAAAALSATQARVGVKVGDNVAVIPWDQSLADTLAGCT
jgi:hypothetical protein